MGKSNIDRLYKEKLEAYAPGFTEAAWEGFAPKLKTIPNQFWKNWNGYILGGTVLGLVSVLVYFFHPNSIADENSTSLVENAASVEVLLDSNRLYEKQPLITGPETLHREPAVDSGSLSENTFSQIQGVNPKQSIVFQLDVDKTTTSSHSLPEQVAESPATLLKVKEEKKQSDRNVLNANTKMRGITNWRDTISEREMMRYLFSMEESASTSRDNSISGFGDSYKMDKPLHLDLAFGPMIKWLRPVDGFSKNELEILGSNPAWRFMGLNISLVLNQKFSIGAGVISGKTTNYHQLPEAYRSYTYPPGYYQHFPGWDDDFMFGLDHIRIVTDQLFFPVDVKYTQKIYRGLGLNFKAGIVPHYIRKQEFYYTPPIYSSRSGYLTATQPKAWQLSYVQSGLGINYQISRRFSTYLDGEYWHAIQPIGGEQNRYRLMGLTFGVNFHFLPE